MKPLPLSTFLYHSASWLVFFSLLIVLNHEITGGELYSMLSRPAYLLFCLTYLICFYLTAYYLVPKLYLKKRFLLYAASIVLLLTVIFFIKPFDRLIFQPDSVHRKERIRKPPPGEEKRFPGNDILHVDIISIYLLFILIGFAMATQINNQLKASEQRAIRAEADKVSAELAFLKAQISPHFLFNTLNNIYTLAVTKNERTADSIVKLSEILRYLTEDASKDLVSLEDEVKCITNYIELQRLRLGKKFVINFIVSGDLENRFISPLILLTFIENAFKYGVSKHDMFPITIKLEVEEHQIRFYAENKIFEKQNIMESTGVGIENTQQRLEHMYPSRYVLIIKNDEDVYAVVLLIET